MRHVTIDKNVPFELKKKAAAVAFIHDVKHWSVKKKLYVTRVGTFAVRAAKTIKVRLVK